MSERTLEHGKDGPWPLPPTEAVPRTWDCDGETCSCHDPSICGECGCLHNEEAAQSADGLREVRREIVQTYAAQMSGYASRGDLAAVKRFLGGVVIPALQRAERAALSAEPPATVERCEHLNAEGQRCIVRGKHQRASGLIHSYEARPIVIEADPEAGR